jgi:hypothetical protein
MSLVSSEVCVVIPHYRDLLESHEQSSLRRCMSVLPDYPKVLVKPQGVTFRRLLDEYPMLGVQEFADEYFQGIAGYNRLMLSDGFYSRFAQFEYILVHQLDAFVFSDQLASWCRRGFDYVGAPWLPPEDLPAGTHRRVARWIQGYCYRLTDRPSADGVTKHLQQFMYRAGNGGLSLRRVSAMRSVLARLDARADRFRQSVPPAIQNEDMFFSVEANRFWPNLSIPGWRAALQFAWELQPARARMLSGGVLPFGCHAWNKLHREDWRSIFASAGLSLDQLL